MRSNNPCKHRLRTYEAGDLVFVEPSDSDLASFYKQVLGIKVDHADLSRGIPAHFLGWGRMPHEKRSHVVENPADSFLVRVVAPFGNTIVVSCCQIKKKLTPIEALAFAGEEIQLPSEIGVKVRLAKKFYRSPVYKALSIFREALRRM